ncbi:unnamed protein product [Clonostachys rosea]|uniref:Isochorismatase-like domain-containing protein n=1 Tax=Bionectria ochroleuca TaxID=29856 RepID=A0ABY6UCE9_BIOOC|nr:unnamed protein product [Clonostachys rosea]
MTTSSAPSHPSHYPPSQTALLFLDYQNVLVNMIADEERKQKLISSAKELLATARANNVAIIHCLIDTDNDPPTTNKVSEQWLTVHKPLLGATPELAQEYGELAPSDSPDGVGHESVSLRPPGYRSVLVNDDLLHLLREKLGVSHLILGGIATSGAILGTATHGTDLDFVVSVVEDAVWDPSETVHRALIDNTIPTLAWVLETKEAVGYLTKK